MGQKANVNSLNISRIKDWCSSWFVSDIEYKKVLFQDFFILAQCKSASITRVKILRYSRTIIIFMYVINFPDKTFMSSTIKSILNNHHHNIETIIIIFRKQSFQSLCNCANFCALQISLFVENRLKFKSHTVKVFVKKLALYNTGVKLKCKGRLNNVDMAKSESIVEGKVSLQSFAKPISYGFFVANTLKGLQSIKVWLL